MRYSHLAIENVVRPDVTTVRVRREENAISAKPTDTRFHYCHLRLKPSLNSAPSDRGICRVKAKPPRSAVTVRI